MESDFLDAHHRHWDDAERLYHSGRLANADHLFGMAAECGLKRLMIVFGMPLTNSVPSGADKVHADKAWLRYETYRSGHHQGISYTLAGSNPYDDWDVSQRYANQDNFDGARVDPHRTGANEVHTLIKKATLEGLL